MTKLVDEEQQAEGDPGQRGLVPREEGDPQEQAGDRRHDVGHEESGRDSPRAPPPQAAALEPDAQQRQAHERRGDPCDERFAFHGRSFPDWGA
jgi:hypothetical protein